MCLPLCTGDFEPWIIEIGSIVPAILMFKYFNIYVNIFANIGPTYFNIGVTNAFATVYWSF